MIIKFVTIVATELLIIKYNNSNYYNKVTAKY